MSSFKKTKKSNNSKWFISLFLIAILSIAVVFAFIKIDKNEKKDTIDTTIFTYSIGSLNADGKYEENSSTIYTENYYSVDGLTVELKEDATITYSLFFYNESTEFIESTSDLTTNYDASSVPETAKYFRIMIIPNDSFEILESEVDDYAKQLTVTIETATLD